jgi:carboxylesterase type B
VNKTDVLPDPAESRAFTMQVFNNPPPQESEDCLYLNVYTPSSLPPVGGFPVMFWLYGGALQFGNAGQTGYDGSSFAAFENVILVSTNYRTNGMFLVALLC